MKEKLINYKFNRVFKAGIAYTIGNILLKGITFLTIPIFTRLMSTEDYGIYNTFVAYESIFFVFIGFAIHSSYKNAKYRYQEHFDNYISISFLFLCFCLLFWIFISSIFSYVLCRALDINKISLIMLILYSFSSAVLQCINTYFAINYQYKFYLLISFISALANIVLSILFIKTIFTTTTYLGRIFGTVIPSFLISICIIIYIFKKSKPTLNIDYIKWGLKYSLPIIPHGISQVILSQFDRIMIKQMIGAAQAGIYSFSYNIYTIISVVTNSLTSVWEPWFYEKMYQKDYESIKKNSSLYIIGILIFSSLLMFIAPEIIKLMGSQAYWSAKYCVFPIIVSGFFSFLYTLPSSVEYYFEKTKFIALGTICAAIINIVLNFIVLKRFSYVSAAYTTLFTYFVYFLFHYFLSKKIFNKNLFSKSIIIFSIITIILVMCICIIFIDNFTIRFSMFCVLLLIVILTILQKIRKE